MSLAPRIDNLASGITGLTTVTANYTITTTDGFSKIWVDTTSGQISVTLPSVSANIGRTLTITKIDSVGNAVIISTPGAETINGSNNAGLYNQYASITITSDGSNWSIDSSQTPTRTATLGSDTGNINGSNTQILQMSIPEGVWLAEGVIRWSQTGGSSLNTYLAIGIGFTSASFPSNDDQVSHSYSGWTVGGNIQRFSRVLTVGTATDIFLNAFPLVISGSVTTIVVGSGSFMRYTRLA